jgi:transcriptional regulator with XRE-family HTH domain
MSVQPEVSPDPEWTFGDRMRKARSRSGMDQREFADAIGVTPSALAQWETDRATPREIVAVAKRVEVLTGVRTAWLLDIEDKTPRPPPTADHPPRGASKSVGAGLPNSDDGESSNLPVSIAA